MRQHPKELIAYVTTSFVLTLVSLVVYDFLVSAAFAQEAGVKGARIHVEQATAADYEQILRDFAACLSSAKARAA